MKKIGLVNQKGGVSKTTTAVNVASILAEKGYKILVIDIDPQCNASTGLGIEKSGKNIYSVFQGKIKFHEAIKQVQNINEDWAQNFHILPSHIGLSNAEMEFQSKLRREELLNKAYEESEPIFKDDPYDYIIVDTNPSLGLLTINAMAFADSLIIPMDTGIYAMDGLENLVSVIKQVRKELNSNLDIEGILLTQVDGRSKEGKEFYEALKGSFGDLVFDTIIHNNIEIKRSQRERKPINVYNKNASGAEYYYNLVEELISDE